jgi:DEAD/DEAH box helicase domain-containing protein
VSEGSFVFDLETQRTAREVGGWSHVDKMGFSAAVLLNVHEDGAHHFLEQDIEALLAHLNAADEIVGFNLLEFDYAVLQPYGFTLNPEIRLKTIDLLDHIHRRLGFRLPLDNLASATLGTTKSADGLQAVRWYREGRLDKILAYCEQDVRVTKALWLYGRTHGQVKYRDRNYRLASLPVSW